MEELDLFRLKPYELTEAQKAKVQEIKEKAKELLEVINNGYSLVDGKTNYQLTRDQDCLMAATFKLEECVMWAVKGNTAKMVVESRPNIPSTGCIVKDEL
ncbi:MAG: hypothetical protein ACJAY9_000801 [Flavobacteriales bacterium]|jgi:hypothetical protein